MNKIYKKRIIDKSIEVLKFDGNWVKLPLVSGVLVASKILSWLNRDSVAFRILCKTFCTGWYGSFTPITRYIKTLHGNRTDQKARLSNIRRDLLLECVPDSRTTRFFTDPSDLFIGIIMVVREYDGVNKGVIIINYSSYFIMVAKLFDIEKIAERYTIVLEPSWAGFCEMSVLIFAQLDDPVLVMTFEDRDQQFLNEINTNLVPVNLGNGWWVDHRVFEPTHIGNRDIDILMVAAWAAYKRHFEVFKALSALKKRGLTYNVVLAGYSGDVAEIKHWADHFDITDWITYYDSIPPSQVGQLYGRAKVNLLWSRFEGNNRAIIEGMLCDTPCIVRNGHNYGQRYDYINSSTGEFSTESALPEKLIHVIDNYKSYNPRHYVMSEHTCLIATERLDEAVSRLPAQIRRNETKKIAAKINMLDGMEYFNPADGQRFLADYDYLRCCIRQSVDQVGTTAERPG